MEILLEREVEFSMSKEQLIISCLQMIVHVEYVDPGKPDTQKQEAQGMP